MRSKEVIKIGSTVRSFDFTWTDGCYIEGTIEAIVRVQGNLCYKIPVNKKVWAKQEVDEPLRCYVYPPIDKNRIKVIW